MMDFLRADDHDYVSETNRPKAYVESEILQKETGWDRLMMMFTFDSGLSPELKFVHQAVTLGGASGAAVGGINFARQARENFIRKHQADAFTSEMEATRQLYDKMILEFYRGAWRFGWRMAFFSGIYVLIAMGGSVYRNKFGITEQVAAGALSGSVFKMNMGLKGTLAGCFLGSVLGAASGCSTYFLTKSFGVTMPEFRYWQHAYWIQDYNEKKLKRKKALEQQQATAFLTAGTKKSAPVEREEPSQRSEK